MDITLPPGFAMLMTYQAVRTGLVMLVGLILAVALHEFGHAAAAVWLGDPTPRNPGRMLGMLDPLGELLGVGRGRANRYTVNPLAHADPVGTVLLPITAQFLLPGAMLIGWGRPVPFNPLAARRKVSPWRMVVLVSLAGPASNLLQAMAWAGLLAFCTALGAHGSSNEVIRSLVVGALPGLPIGWLHLLVSLNLLLAVFNLLPVPPLDGGQILTAWLDQTHRDWAAWLRRYGLFVFLVLLPVLPALLDPVQGWALRFAWAVSRAAGGPG